MNLRRSVRLQLDDGNDSLIAFEVPETVRSALPEGTDEIAQILRDDGAAITAFEQRYWQAMPWLHDQPL